MRLQDCKFLADENIHFEVVDALRAEGRDVVSVREAGLLGKDDQSVLGLATEQDRAVVTHDRDFGTLAVADGVPYVGIVYLRPGHILPEFTLQTLRCLFEQSLDLPTPFILVAQRSGDRVKIRVRSQPIEEASNS